jgi:3,4-dihydroxy 2-butanone 4-phosphate synthase/GTP cyclohydrolase II
VPVRLHREDTIVDVFRSGESAITRSLELIKQEGRGVIVYLREGAVGVAAQGRNETASTDDNVSERSRRQQWREIGLGAQILKDLGLSSIRVISTRERQFKGLSGFGVEIESTEIIDS